MESYWSRLMARGSRVRLLGVLMVCFIAGTALEAAVPKSAYQEDCDMEALGLCCDIDRHFFTWPPWCVDVTITCEGDGITIEIDIEDAKCL